jgi:hypothetical protein
MAIIFGKTQFFGNNFFYAHFVPKVSLDFWNLRKKTNILIPNMTHFEKKNVSPPIKASLSWSENFRWSSARGDAFFCTKYFFKYYYFGHIYIVLVRFFHILPIGGG